MGANVESGDRILFAVGRLDPAFQPTLFSGGPAAVFKKHKLQGRGRNGLEKGGSTDAHFGKRPFGAGLAFLCSPTMPALGCFERVVEGKFPLNEVSTILARRRARLGSPACRRENLRKGDRRATIQNPFHFQISWVTRGGRKSSTTGSRKEKFSGGCAGEGIRIDLEGPAKC